MTEIPEKQDLPEDDELAADVTQDAPSSEDALRTMMQQYFIDWASYVVKDRAIPDVDDGLKPVQRRILFTLSQMDDGRFHKVTMVQGQTMKYHPHGDASIKDALVVLANKGYFIDRQGNFGNIITGDPAAAARYIECRLAKFATEVLFNNAITEFVDSYDGRGKEPVTLPAKVPALLMLGSDGIAVGMATHIFPHNFCELLEAEIAILEDRPFQVLPDFQTGGLMDASEYDDGRGFIRVRAKIETEGDKRVIIRELPGETTTEQLIASIEKAARNGKLKIASIADLTSEEVNIEIALNRGIYAEQLADYTPVTRGGASYFTFHFGPVWGIVIDCGEDKRDHQVEYGRTICCEAFRAEEEEYIDKAIAAREYEKYPVRLIVSHVPFAFRLPPPFDIEQERYARWCEKAKAFRPTLMLTGHLHQCWTELPGGEHDTYGQPCPVVCSSLVKMGENEHWHVSGALTLEGDTLTVRYPDSDGADFKPADVIRL